MMVGCNSIATFCGQGAEPVGSDPPCERAGSTEAPWVTAQGRTLDDGPGGIRDGTGFDSRLRVCGRGWVALTSSVSGLRSRVRYRPKTRRAEPPERRDWAPRPRVIPG